MFIKIKNEKKIKCNIKRKEKDIINPNQLWVNNMKKTIYLLIKCEKLKKYIHSSKISLKKKGIRINCRDKNKNQKIKIGNNQ